MSYISQEDYKNLMRKFQAETPKGMLKESLDPVGKEDDDIDNDGDTDKTDKYLANRRKAVGQAIGKGRAMKESNLENDKWYEDFENGLRNLANNRYISQFEYAQYMKALDHVDPMDNYSEMNGHDAAKEFVDDLRTKNQMDADEEQYKRETGLEEELEFDGDDEEREARAKKAEMDDEEAENAEIDEEWDSPYDGGADDLAAMAKDEKLNLRAPSQAAKNIAKKYGAELKPEYDEYQRSFEEYMQAIRKYKNNTTDPEFREIATAHNKLVKDYQNKVLGLARQEMEDSGEKPVVARNLAYGYSDEDWPSEFVTALAQEMKGMKEGLEEAHNYQDPAFLAKAIAKAHPELQKFALEDRKMFHRAAFKYAGELMRQGGESDNAVVNLINGYADEDWPSDFISALGKELEGMAEGLHMPPLQATGETVGVTEQQAPFGFSVLSPDERQQLKEYINSIKTIKEEIAKLTAKAGKKVKEGDLGGDRTGLVMTKSEMYEGEGNDHEAIESSLGDKLYQTFNKVTQMALKQIVADGWDEDQAVSFLQAEIEEHAKEAMMSQYDPH